MVSAPSSPASATETSPERAAHEACSRLCEVLGREDPSDGLMEMVTDGFFARWIPEVVDMQMEQDPVHRHKDVLTHTVAVTASTPPQLRLRFAAWMHDIGKPATHRVGPTGVTFRHHEAVGARITRRRLGAMGFDDEFVADVARLVELSGRFKGFGDGWTDSAVRRYVVDAGALLGDLNLLVRHDCTTRHAHKAAALQAQVDELERRIRRLAAADAEARRRPPLSGEEIMDLLGIPPGPAVGAAIALLLAADPPLDRTDAEQRLRSWWEQRT
jgi:poly(A) polymerase